MAERELQDVVQRVTEESTALSGAQFGAFFCNVLDGLFFGHERVGVFDEDAERLVTAVSALAALAIENARLHEAARRELAASRQAYHERDHVARVLQESLLPPRLPEVEGLELAARYVPGEGMVGGDLYDVFALGEGAFGAAIGDVQG